MVKYAAFISYRREGGADTARLIRSAIGTRGYPIFLDVDDLGASHFDDRLLDEIERAPNFIVILTPDALHRCKNEKDWLRREIAHAIATGRNIIPVLKEGFAFPRPEELPEEIAFLPRYNCVPYSHIYFDSTIDKLIHFFEGKKPKRSSFKKALLLPAALILLLLIWAGLERYPFQPTKTAVAPEREEPPPLEEIPVKATTDTEEEAPPKPPAAEKPDYAKTVKMDLNDPETFIRRGNAYRNQGEPEKGLADFDQAIALSPDRAEAWFGRGQIHRVLKDHEQAIADFTRSISLLPDHVPSFQQRGNLYKLQGRYKEAIADLTRAHELNPDDAEILNDLAWMLATCPDDRFRQGQKALALALKSVTFSHDPQYLDTLSAAYAETGDFEAAVANLAKALSMVQGYPKLTNEFIKRLRCYRNRLPWREEKIPQKIEAGEGAHERSEAGD